MKLKVCGLNNVSNIKEVVKLQPDFVGFIFHKASKRNCVVPSDFVKKLNTAKTKKVGVFVNEPIDFVLRIVNSFGLDYVQLHGDEGVAYCKELKNKGVKIIKVFSVDVSFNMNQTADFQFCDYILFDTKGDLPGGNGFQFNWKILECYTGSVPIILSGGIDLSHSSVIKKMSREIPHLSVVDVNSKFESEPGLKKIEMVKSFMNEIKNKKYVLR